MSVVEPLHRPDAALMRQHLSHLFGRYAEGWLELAWRDPASDAWRASWHRVTEIDALVDEAVRVNTTPGVNVYIGAGIRHPDTMPGGRSHDSDAWKLTAVYVDLDEPGSIETARAKWQFHKPTLIVQTGQIPHLRAQAYWLLEEPLTDHNAWRAMLKGMARSLGGDPSVTNPGRILRLAGSIAWPVKEGRVVEQTRIATTTTEPPPRAVYSVKALTGVFPFDPADLAPAPSAPVDEVVTRSSNALGLQDRITDGREKYMTKTLFAVFVEWCGTNGVEPTVDELVTEAWPQYEKNVDFTRPGRGFDEFKRKAAYLVQRFEAGEIRGMATIEEVIDAYRGRRQQQAVEYAASAFEEGAQAQAQPRPPVHIQTTAEFVAEWAPKPFLLKPIIEAGRLYTLTGPTGTGKTAIALLMALHIAMGQELAARRVRQSGVLFLAGENHEDVRTRWMTMLRIAGIDPATVPVHFVGGRFNIEQQFAVVQAHIAAHPTGLVIADTLQAFFDGDDSNSNEQMKALAHTFRRMANLGPAVLVPAHPVKNASKDRNVPYGGGALLNEIDGNLSLWGEPEAVQLSWCGKFRGSFEPVDFALDVVETPGVVDADGDPVKTIKARVLGAIEAEFKAQQTDQALTRLLFLLDARPGIGTNALCKAYQDESPEDMSRSRSSTRRRIDTLVAEKLIERTLGKLRLTAKGQRYIGRNVDD